MSSLTGSFRGVTFPYQARIGTGPWTIHATIPNDAADLIAALDKPGSGVLTLDGKTFNAIVEAYTLGNNSGEFWSSLVIKFVEEGTTDDLAIRTEMDFKFGHDELMTIAGEDTPEEIAKRLLDNHRHVDFVATQMRTITKAGRVNPNAIESLEREIAKIHAEMAADEDRLLTLVLDGKTRLRNQTRASHNPVERLEPGMIQYTSGGNCITIHVKDDR